MRKGLAIAASLASALALAGCDFLGGGGKTDDPTALTSTPDAAQGGSVALSAAAFEGVLTGVGADDGWRVFIDPASGVVFEDRDSGETVRAAYAAPAEAGGAVAFAAAPLTLSVSAGPCTAGVEGVSYPFSLSVTKADGSSVTGCLYRPWTTQIVSLAPAVMSCLAVTPGQGSVSYIEAEGDGRVLVRVVGETGAEVDCRASLTPGAPLTPTPADPNTRYPGERDALFYRAPGENPGGECYTAPEVKDANGQVIGWLADPAGC